MELYNSINKNSTNDEKLEACKAIMKSTGDRAMAICSAKLEGWWKYEVAEPCQAIMEAPGDRAWAISLAKLDGWWKDKIAEPCQAIMEAPGNRAWAISLSKSDSWWKDEVAEPCQAIMEAPGNRAYAVSLAKTNGWWKNEVAEPCKAILEAPGDRDSAIEKAKSRGWWKNPYSINGRLMSFDNRNIINTTSFAEAVYALTTGDCDAICSEHGDECYVINKKGQIVHAKDLDMHISFPIDGNWSICNWRCLKCD